MHDNHIPTIVSEFQRSRMLAEGALVQVNDEGFFAVSGPEDNSLAVIVKHVAGNLVSRWTDFLTTDGEKPDRDRDGEFEIRAGDTREHLMAFWERGWSVLFAAVSPLTDADLSREIRM